MRSTWAYERHSGSASTFHAMEPHDDQRQAWWLDVDRPSLVLGSAQAATVVDQPACDSAGVEVVKRRSGGGAVLLLPGRCAWLDVIVARDDVLWDDDIGRSMWWFGEMWASALGSIGVADVQVHRGPIRRTTWSKLVCFDGLGAGEVTVGGHKAVGISQRRTRGWARMQSSVYLSGDGGVSPNDFLVPLLAEPRPAVADLAEPAVLDVRLDRLRAAVESALTER